MTKHPKRPRDPAQLTKLVLDIGTGEIKESAPRGINAARRAKGLQPDFSRDSCEACRIAKASRAASSRRVGLPSYRPRGPRPGTARQLQAVGRDAVEKTDNANISTRRRGFFRINLRAGARGSGRAARSAGYFGPTASISQILLIGNHLFKNDRGSGSACGVRNGWAP